MSVLVLVVVVGTVVEIAGAAAKLLPSCTIAAAAAVVAAVSVRRTELELQSLAQEAVGVEGEKASLVECRGLVIEVAAEVRSAWIDCDCPDTSGPVLFSAWNRPQIHAHVLVLPGLCRLYHGHPVRDHRDLCLGRTKTDETGFLEREEHRASCLVGLEVELEGYTSRHPPRRHRNS